jgi:hypothetical protein
MLRVKNNSIFKIIIIKIKEIIDEQIN